MAWGLGAASAVGPPRRRGRSAYRAWALHGQGQVPWGVKLMPHWHPSAALILVGPVVVVV